jgi:hypothetical protein
MSSLWVRRGPAPFRWRVVRKERAKAVPPAKLLSRRRFERSVEIDPQLIVTTQGAIVQKIGTSLKFGRKADCAYNWEQFT